MRRSLARRARRRRRSGSSARSRRPRRWTCPTPTGSPLIDDETGIDEGWLEAAETVGLTSGASAPERLVQRVCEWFRARGVTEIRPLAAVAEDVAFRLPVEVRRAAGSTA